LWHIGNTSVRTPYRLREALKALHSSQFHGNLLGKENEQAYAELLDERSVLRLDRKESGKDFSDLGRKWRSALAQLGFITMHFRTGQRQGMDPKLERFVQGIPILTGRPYEVTPNGNRLIQAESVSQQQECFLRALAAYRIPSILEIRYRNEFATFSPLRFVLNILLEMEKTGEEPFIHYEEMALLVQCRTPETHSIGTVIAEILEYRNQRESAENKRKFFNNRLSAAVAGNRSRAQTLRDYADLNFRYLKATGLFYSRGRSIGILQEKHTLAELLVSEAEEPYIDPAYVKRLWKGARLPTDDKIKALEIIASLAKRLKTDDIKIERDALSGKSVEELSQIRCRLEDRLRQDKEQEYAAMQAEAWQEILQIMEAFRESKRSVKGIGGTLNQIPGDERPAYFEWVIWRAFLAIDSLENAPWEARKFKVDQDFLPLSHAPSRGPDMIFVFEDYVLVVEVTLTTSSRQEAAEGEPVRRHVAEIAAQYEEAGKRVFCMFIALNIDSNTAETFKSGTWYKKDDTRLPLQIVPITLGDFIRLFRAGFETKRLSPHTIMQLLMECRISSNQDAPEWKRKISAEVERFISKWK